MACIDSTAAQYKLLRPTVAIKREYVVCINRQNLCQNLSHVVVFVSLFERCLQAAANDLAHSGECVCVACVGVDVVLVNMIC